MQILRRRLWVMLLLLTLVVSGINLSIPNSAQAQSDEVLARIDDAMAHLSNRLGQTITRQSDFWQWSEQVYSDASLGCPVAGETYEPAERRAYRIRITIDGVEFDYRAEKDGSVLILCVDGQADASSIGIGPVPDSSVTLPVSDWYTVIYTGEDDRLHWINGNGEVASRTRPLLPNEAANANAQMRISRNGRVLIVVSTLTDGTQALGFFDLQSGFLMQVHNALVGETIVLGDQRYMTDPNSTRTAVGFYTIPAQGGQASWRLIQFDLTTGAAIDELSSSGSEISGFVGGEVFSQGLFLPYVWNYGFDQDIASEVIYLHFLNLGEPPVDSPALAWYPAGIPNIGQELISSPHTRVSADWNPATQTVVFPYLDANTGLMTGNNPYTSFNAVATGTPSNQGGAPGPSLVFSTPTLRIGATKWVSNGQQIVLYGVDQSTEDNWYVMPANGGNPTLLDANTSEVMGVPTGFVSTLTGGTVLYTPVNGAGSIVHQNPTNNPVDIIWATTPGSAMQLGSLSLQSGGVDAGVDIDPNAVVNCPGTLPSQVAVGTLARVTFTDGTPLRLRETPGGTFLTDLAEGTQFNVVGGPQCQGQFTWWQVTVVNSGQSGWVAEGDTDTYFIEPAVGSAP